MHGLHMPVAPSRVTKGGIASFKGAFVGSCAGARTIRLAIPLDKLKYL